MAKSTKVKDNSRLYTVIGGIIGLMLLIISIFKWGFIGQVIDKSSRYLFGQYHIAILIVAIIFTFIFTFIPKLTKQSKTTYLGIGLIISAFLLMSASINHYDLIGFDSLSYYISNSSKIFNYTLNASGGFIGQILYSLSTLLFDVYGTYIFTAIIALIGSILIFGLSSFSKLKFSLPKRKEKVAKPKQVKVQKEKKSFFKKPAKEQVIAANLAEEIPYDVADIDSQSKSKSSIFISLDQETKVTKDLTKEDNKGQLELKLENDVVKEPYVVGGMNYSLPKLTLLDTSIANRTSPKNAQAAKEKGQHLIDVLSEFNIDCELIDVHIGPSVTKFEIRPDTSVKVSRISSISDNIKMELSAKSIRIEAPIPGKNTVGIEVPNVENTPVKLYELLKDLPSDQPPLLFALGKDLMGNIIFSDLAKMPHLLVAGATGAGKSVALNAIITTILLRTTPEEVRMLLIDPKKVEFNSFASSPHLMTDIISDPTQANAALNKVVEIMDQRYRDFAAINVKNIKAYNEYLLMNPEADLPKLELLVVIIDELADLMVVAGKEVEQSIQRITQLARAAGIHLIVATQRPSTEVITGLIKANIPSRISFAVSSGIDSRTILDAVGAEKLLGNGDMLYYPVGYSAPLRLQGVYITDSEVNKVATFAAKQPSPDHFVEFDFSDTDASPQAMANFEDALYDDIKSFVIREQKASTSLLQRHFGIGYNRAARIIDALENNGIIGPMSGSKPREVFVSHEEELEF